MEKGRWKACFIAATVTALQQLSGINAIMINLIQVGTQWSEKQSSYFLL